MNGSTLTTTGSITGRLERQVTQSARSAMHGNATACAAAATFEGVLARAESIASDHEHAIEVMDVGDEVRQGDVYVTRVKAVPAGAVRAEKPDAQLAPGTSQGSRHCLRSLDGLALYRVASPGPLDGPVIDAPNGCAIDHPEHGDRVLPPGVYAVTYQRGFSEELRRVED